MLYREQSLKERKEKRKRDKKKIAIYNSPDIPLHILLQLSVIDKLQLIPLKIKTHTHIDISMYIQYIYLLFINKTF